MKNPIKIDDQKQVELAAEALARLLIQQLISKKNGSIKNIEMKTYGKSN